MQEQRNGVSGLGYLCSDFLVVDLMVSSRRCFHRRHDATEGDKCNKIIIYCCKGVKLIREMRTETQRDKTRTSPAGYKANVISLNKYKRHKRRAYRRSRVKFDKGAQIVAPKWQ